MEDRKAQLERLRKVEEQLAQEAKRNEKLLEDKRNEMGITDPVVPRAKLDKQMEPGDKKTPDDVAKKLNNIEATLEKQVEKQEELLEKHREQEEESEEEEEESKPKTKEESPFSQEESGDKTIIEAVPVTERPTKEELEQEEKENEKGIPSEPIDKSKLNSREKKVLKQKELKEKLELTDEQVKKKSRRKTATLGFFVLLLVTVGLVSIGSFVFAKGKDLFGGKSKMEEYQAFIAPVVLVDPAPFSEPGQIDEKLRLESAIWSLFMNSNNSNRYNQDDQGMTIVPSADILSEATKLFGPGLNYTHENFGNSFFTFYYDKTIDSYKVPVTGKNTMKPRVVSMENKGDEIRLLVEYIPIIMSATEQDSVLKAEKTVTYVLKKEGKTFYIKSLEPVSGISPSAPVNNQSENQQQSDNNEGTTDNQENKDNENKQDNEQKTEDKTPDTSESENKNSEEGNTPPNSSQNSNTNQ